MPTSGVDSVRVERTGDVREQDVHQYHDGIARELYSLYSQSEPWFALSRAVRDELLTAEELACLSDATRAKLQQWSTATINTTEEE